MLAYSEMGEQSLSPIAFRLAAENALDLLCMTYKNAYGEAMHKKIGGWLIAGLLTTSIITNLSIFQYVKKWFLQTRFALVFLNARLYLDLRLSCGRPDGVQVTL